MNPMILFPEEQWRRVLGKLDDSDDIVNLFYSYPTLSLLLYKTVLSTCLMPVLFPKYLDFNDARNCRLVSNRWKDAVDNTLETHPDRKPYEARGHHSKKITLRGPFSYQMLTKFITTRRVVASTRTFNEVMSLPEQVNPFLGRFFYMFVATRLPRLTVALPLMDRFGEHIHYAHFDFSHLDINFTPHQMIQTLLRCLFHLPNLKRLKLSGHITYIFETESCHELEWTWGPYNNTPSTIYIPARLESLDIATLQYFGIEVIYKLVTTLISHDHLHKFAVKADYWDNRYLQLCPHLTELKLILNNYDESEWLRGWEKEGSWLLRRVLIQFFTRINLQKLSITDQNICFIELIQILRQCRGIQAVEVVDEEGGFPDDTVIDDDPLEMEDEILWAKASLHAPSVTHVVIDDSVGFTIEDLSMLPNLEYLGVRMKNSMIGRILRDCSKFISNLVHDNAPVPMVGGSLHVYFLGRNNLSQMELPIWQVLPRLKMFTVLDLYGVIIRRYVKECKNKVFKC